MNYSWAKPGVKVVCVDDVWPLNSWYGDENLPVEGQVYTISDTLVIEDVLCLRFEEIRNTVREYAQGPLEAAFIASRFRPLITRTQEQDVALFKHHLETERA